jgi:hypothetical protein
MRATIIQTAVVTSLVTALAVSGFAFYAVPKLTQPQAQLVPMDPNYAGVTLQPVGYQTVPTMQPAFYAAQQRPVVYQQPAPRIYSPAAVRTAEPASAPVYEPVRQKRSTGKSVLIVAGSSGAGAAIGGLTGGKKGAAIGAIAGGVAGLIYDRTTANPK